MEAIRQYALSVICGALVVSVLLDLSAKGRFQKQIRLVCSIFFATILLKPLVSLKIPELSQFKSDFLEQAERAADAGEKIHIQSLAGIIQSECEAYILKEARAIRAEVEVQVELDGGNPPAPVAVTLRGTFDADSETQLSQLLADEFGIPKERQTWLRHPSSHSSWQNTSMFS